MEKLSQGKGKKRVVWHKNIVLKKWNIKDIPCIKETVNLNICMPGSQPYI